MGGTYTQVRDYLLSDLKLPEEEQQPIGVWIQRHWRYLKEHRRATYATLLTSGRLNSYLIDLDRSIAVAIERQVGMMLEDDTEYLRAVAVGDLCKAQGLENMFRLYTREAVYAAMVYV